MSPKSALTITLALSLLAGLVTGSAGVVVFAFPFIGVIMFAILIAYLFWRDVISPSR